MADHTQHFRGTFFDAWKSSWCGTLVESRLLEQSSTLQLLLPSRVLERVMLRCVPVGVGFGSSQKNFCFVHSPMERIGKVSCSGDVILPLWLREHPELPWLCYLETNIKPCCLSGHGLLLGLSGAAVGFTWASALGELLLITWRLH